MATPSSFFLRLVVRAGLVALAFTVPVYASRAPDLAKFEVRFERDTKTEPPALASYLQQFAATVEREWFTILEESGARPPMGSRVTMHVMLNANGEVDIVGVDDAGSGRAGVWLCADALQRQQPYGKWTPEMIAAAGRNQTLSFTFYHR